MRLVGIIAVFVLTVTAIVQAAFLVRLSGKVESLTEQVQTQALVDPGPVGRSGSLATTAGAPAPRMPIPRLDTKAPPPSAAEPASGGGPSTSTIGEALTTPEGREYLKKALDGVKEDERRARLAENAQEDVEREKRHQERLSRTLGLSGGEQAAISNLYASMQSARARIVEEMKAGVKTAEQADDEIDALEDKTETAVNSLLGEQRLRQMREARRAERMQRREQRAAARQAGQPPPPGPLP